MISPSSVNAIYMQIGYTHNKNSTFLKHMKVHVNYKISISKMLDKTTRNYNIKTLFISQMKIIRKKIRINNIFWV